MKRKLYQTLHEWKKSDVLESLLIKGARQVGKTTLIQQFGAQEFKHMLYLNFEDQLDMRQAFDAMPNPDEAIKTLQAYGIAQGIFSIESADTLIVLDEIQLCKRAYSLLKPLSQMGRFKIIASGSLLGILLNQDFLDPGPTVRHLEMHPMDFEEFLWAQKGEAIMPVLQSVRQTLMEGKPLNETLHQTMNRAVRDYLLIGGMPQAVHSFSQNQDLGQVFLIQKAILNLYRSDIQKYQSSNDGKVKTLQVFDSLPLQLTKENRRFTYSTVEKGKSARDYRQVIEWLEHAGILLRSYQVNHLKGSLIDGKKDAFKAYLNDTGLMLCMLGQDYIYKVQKNQLDLFKGALYEQLMAQMLTAKNIPLYYYRLNDFEIDFLIAYEARISPLECKSGGNTKSKSLKAFVTKWQPKEAFKISLNNVNVSDDVIKALPHYAIALLPIAQWFQLGKVSNQEASFKF